MSLALGETLCQFRPSTVVTASSNRARVLIYSNKVMEGNYRSPPGFSGGLQLIRSSWPHDDSPSS